MNAALAQSSHDGDPRESALADRALLGTPASEALPDLRIVEHLDESYDYTAAAADVALFPPTERPPEALRRRVVGTLERLSEVAATASTSSTVPFAASSASSPPLQRGVSWGWIAAAAAVAFAAAAWWPAPSSTSREAAQTAMSSRDALALAPGSAVVSCTCTDDPLCGGKQTCGDVVWNSERGEGYLRLTGIEANDPSEFQYQLWIVDSTRDERYPVDGGVFDVPGDSDEVLVEIRAAVPVGDAALFAVSVEKPGGTVVSDRRFVAVAPVG